MYPICCISAFLSARWLRPLISSWSLRCWGGWKYLHGGFSRLHRPWKWIRFKLIILLIMKELLSFTLLSSFPEFKISKHFMSGNQSAWQFAIGNWIVSFDDRSNYSRPFSFMPFLQSEDKNGLIPFLFKLL